MVEPRPIQGVTLIAKQRDPYGATLIAQQRDPY